MRKLILLFFYFSFSFSNAQTWCPSGATWHYGFYNGYTKLQYSSDTTINSILCKKLESTSEWYWASILHNSTNNSYYTYSNSGVNYIYNNRYGQNQFDTLFDINAQIGDKWKMPLTDTLCNDTINTVTVLDTGHLFINSTQLKWLYVKINNNPVSGNSFDTIIENLGYTKRFFYYYDYCNLYEGPEYYSLRCYSDNTFGNYNSTSLICDFTISIDEIPNSLNFHFYPNPISSTILTIDFELSKSENMLLEIQNMLGQIVYSDTFKTSISRQTKTIDIGSLPKGAYFIQLKNEYKIHTAKFIKQ
jgi:hypothetical protein